MKRESAREESGNERKLFVKKEFFKMIQNGTKTLEARIGFPSFLSITEGQRLIFSSGEGEEVPVEIVGVRMYRSLEELIQNEEISRLVPGTSREQALKLGQRIFNKEEIRQNGLMILDFKRIEKISAPAT